MNARLWSYACVSSLILLAYSPQDPSSPTHPQRHSDVKKMYDEMTGSDFVDKIWNARALFREFINPVDPDLIASRHDSLRHKLLFIHQEARAQWLADDWTAYDLLNLQSLAGALQPKLMNERLSFLIQHEIVQVKHIAAHTAAWEEEVAMCKEADLPRPLKRFHYGPAVPRSLEMLRKHAEALDARLGYEGRRIRDRREKEMEARRLQKEEEARVGKEVEARVAPGA